MVKYRYDDHHQIIQVINRTSVRGYLDGVMTSASYVLDLSGHYYWETFDGKPRVVEH